MTKTQWYIGAPNGVVLCVDAMRSGGPTGRLFHSYQTDAVEFGGADQMICHMEELYNALNFPYTGTNERSFAPVKKTGTHYTEGDRIMRDETLLSKHGDLGTFIVRVQHRQNSSWQGRITWMEQDKTISFRSIWEMVKLIETAVNTVCAEEDAEEVPRW
ncbi:MAG: hypothetical protein IJQ43_09000 [Oscillospiraceae bacterium]|nr:hypothetical protein [Oscillospiraceae bacterium]